MNKLLKNVGFIALVVIIGTSLITCKEPDDSVHSSSNDIETILSNPMASDFEINNLSQTIENIIPVTITPKSGKSTGLITIYYDGLTELPEISGSFDLTFDVSASDGWQAATGLVGGILTIIDENKLNVQIPIINTQPDDAEITVNSLHSLSISASSDDDGELSYQWYSNTSKTNIGGTQINGETSADYYPPTDSIGIFYYFVEVTNTITDNGDGGNKTASIRSIAASLTINAIINAQIPFINTQPIGFTITVNHTHSLSVSANCNDDGILSYQWYSNTSESNNGGTPVNGAESDDYNPPTDTEGVYYYFVEITNTISDNGDGGNKTAAVRSEAVTLIVNSKINAEVPNITEHPNGATVIFNGSINLSVSANVTDGGTLSYRWYSNTSESSSGGSAIYGVTTASYYPPTGAAGTYYYFVEVTNTITDNGDGGNKSATVMSHAVTLTVKEKVNAQIPVITTQPLNNVAVNVNNSYTLSVTASVADGGTLSYRWYSNTSASNVGGTAISGATAASYNPPTETAGRYYYFSEITNTISDNGDSGDKTATIRSNAIIFTIRINAQTPNITIQPVGGSIAFGGSYTLSVMANVTDGGTLSYRWYRNTAANNTSGTFITGATSASYNPPTSTAGIFYYFVEITNTISNNGDGGSKTTTVRSNTVTLTVNNPVPVASDFNIGNLTQISSHITPVTITPKAAKSNGTITVRYNGSTNLPSAAGSYTVTFDVTASTGWSAVNGLAGGTLIVTQSTTGLVFKLINNNTAYSVSKGTASSAEVIIPAMYNGLPITTIESNGLSNYTNMTSVKIPSSVTSIENGVFYGCSSLINITVENGNQVYKSEGNCLIQISNNILIAGCKNSVIPSSVTSIGYDAFANCSGLTSIIIPSSVTSIDSYAFYGCSGLTSITIPSSATSIGDYAFSGCSGVTSVTIPLSVTSIGDHAFSGCSGVTSVTIPSSVISIGNGAFGNCISLTSITIPSSVKSIGTQAFYNCGKLTSINIPSSVTSIGYGALERCSGLTSITIPFVNGTLSTIFNSYQNSNIPASLKTVIISGGNIDNDAFAGCGSLNNITIGNGVTSIGSGAFSGCSGLTNITIPSSVTSIGNSAFAGCRSMTSMIVENGNQVYKSEGNCLIQISNNNLIAGFKNSIIPPSVMSIGNYAFSGCDSLISITIPSSVTSIGNSAFYDCTGMTSIIIPSSVISIGDSAFERCYNIKSISIPSSVTSIGSVAFKQCSSLTNIEIPYSVTSIGLGMLAGCNSLTSLTIPSAGYALDLIFGYSIPTSLKTVVITGGNNIVNNSFFNCSGLTNITIPSSVTSIGSNAFYGCSSLASISIPSGVTSIGDSAFRECRGLTSITIPSSVTSIGLATFANCNGLTSVTVLAQTPPDIGGQCFNSTNSSLQIRVPAASVAAYKAAVGWSEYADRIVVN